MSIFEELKFHYCPPFISSLFFFLHSIIYLREISQQQYYITLLFISLCNSDHKPSAFKATYEGKSFFSKFPSDKRNVNYTRCWQKPLYIMRLYIILYGTVKMTSSVSVPAQRGVRWYSVSSLRILFCAAVFSRRSFRFHIVESQQQWSINRDLVTHSMSSHSRVNCTTR
jgi:hypothetical protein